MTIHVYVNVYDGHIFGDVKSTKEDLILHVFIDEESGMKRPVFEGKEAVLVSEQEMTKIIDDSEDEVENWVEGYGYFDDLNDDEDDDEWEDPDEEDCDCDGPGIAETDDLWKNCVRESDDEAV